MTITLKVAKKEGKMAPESIPAVVYGPKQESISLAMDKKAFEKVFKEAGESSIVSLDGLGEEIEVLIHDVTFNAVKGGVQHVDFYAIERGKELTTNIPLEFIGEAPALKLGGVLNKALHEVEVTCRPKDLPKNIVVDVSGLVELDVAIRVKDLNLPEGVKMENDLEEAVVMVIPVEEEVEEEVAEVDMEAIEVEAKGKAESDEEEKEA